jgi:hypothetical protein
MKNEMEGNKGMRNKQDITDYKNSGLLRSSQ